jgi:predicted nucleic acid-binding protein
VSLVYADTSVLLAYFYPADSFTRLVTEAARTHSPDFAYWPFLKFELRHTLRWFRGDANGEAAWNALRASEQTQARLRWQADMKADRMLDAADELSAEMLGEIACGSADFLHVAAARRLNRLSELNEFWTCDGEQAALAKKCGLKVKLFELKHPARPVTRRKSGGSR